MPQASRQARASQGARASSQAQASPHALKDGKDIAGELTELARDPRIALRAGELRALAHDLEHTTHLDQWAEVDLVRSFVRPESLAPVPAAPAARGPLRSLVGYLAHPPRDRSPAGIARWLRDGLRRQPVRSGALEAVMGVLVFIPLLVTWVGLREAVGAYGELSRDDPKEATRPFLQLWQSGFGGHLAGVGRFENVALTTVLFIVLLVLLSLWHARVRGRGERDETERSSADEYLLGRLASLLTQAQFALVPHRSASPAQFARELTHAAKQLGELSAKAESSHKALTATGDSLRQAAGGLQAAAQGLSTEIPRLGAMAGQLETAVRAGQEATERAGKESAAAAARFGDRVTAAGATVESAFGTLTSAQKALAAKSESVAQASERASQALVDSTARTHEAIDEMRGATERWDAAAAHWQDAAARLEAGIGRLANGTATAPLARGVPSFPAGADSGTGPGSSTGNGFGTGAGGSTGNGFGTGKDGVPGAGNGTGPTVAFGADGPVAGAGGPLLGGEANTVRFGPGSRSSGADAADAATVAFGSDSGFGGGVAPWHPPAGEAGPPSGHEVTVPRVAPRYEPPTGHGTPPAPDRPRPVTPPPADPPSVSDAVPPSYRAPEPDQAPDSDRTPSPDRLPRPDQARPSDQVSPSDQVPPPGRAPSRPRSSGEGGGA